jgi:hypothetical protein
MTYARILPTLGLAAMSIGIVITLAPQLVLAEPVASVHAKISRIHFDTSADVTIHESTKLDPGQGVVTMKHRAERVGIYHRQLKRFILLTEIPGAVSVPVDMVMPGLPASLASPSGVALEDLSPKGIGKSFEFKVCEPGVYVVYAEWHLIMGGQSRPSPITRRSGPTVVFVKPSPSYEDEARERSASGIPPDVGGVDFQEAAEQFYNDHKNDRETASVIVTAE